MSCLTYGFTSGAAHVHHTFHPHVHLTTTSALCASILLLHPYTTDLDSVGVCCRARGNGCPTVDSPLKGESFLESISRTEGPCARGHGDGGKETKDGSTA